MSRTLSPARGVAGEPFAHGELRLQLPIAARAAQLP